MMIFKFRMLSDEDENFVRDYEVPYDMTLLEFHDFICKDIEYDELEMSSLFLCDKQWQKLREFTLMDMGADDSESVCDTPPVAMESVSLGQVVHNKNERLLFVYDLFEDRAFFLELIEAKKEEEGFEYPRVMFANGKAPDQFDVEAQSGNRSIFDEAMDEYGSFEGDDEYDDE